MLLFQGDFRTEILKIPDNSVNLILTDPPYNIGEFMKGRNVGIRRLKGRQDFTQDGWDNAPPDEWSSMMADFMEQAYRVLAPQGALILFTSFQKIAELQVEAEKNGFYYKTTGVWHRSNPLPRNKDLHFVNSCDPWMYFLKCGSKKTGTFNNDGKVIHDCVECGVAPVSEKTVSKHPTQKPEKLMEFFVKTLSNPGDTVLDPFMGGGTTGIAALKNSREFIGIELNDEYYRRAKARLEQ